MDTAQAIIDALTTQAPGRMSLTELVYVTNRNRAEVCDYLDMLELDGVVTRGMRNAYPGHSDGPAYQVWSMTTDQIEATFDNVVA